MCGILFHLWYSLQLLMRSGVVVDGIVIAIVVVVVNDVVIVVMIDIVIRG